MTHPVIAAATVPLLAGPPVWIDGRRLVDAGLSAAIPFRAALAAGATHVLVLRSRRAGGHHRSPVPLRLERDVGLVREALEAGREAALQRLA